MHVSTAHIQVGAACMHALSGGSIQGTTPGSLGIGSSPNRAVTCNIVLSWMSSACRDAHMAAFDVGSSK